MPTPTQINSEDITELKNSNQRIVDALHLLEVTVSQRFGQLEVKIGQVESGLEAKIAQVESGLEAKIAQVESGLGAKIAQVESKAAANHADAIRRIDVLSSEVKTLTGIGRWALGVVILILGSVGAAIWYAAKLDSRVAQVERVQSQAPTLKPR